MSGSTNPSPPPERPVMALCNAVMSPIDFNPVTNTVPATRRATIGIEPPIPLKNASVSSMIVLSEETRRMQDMMKMYNMYGMDPNMFGGPATLVLNANNELVQYIFNHKDSEHVPMMCEQLYDLAMLSHKPLAPEEMTKFITRSNKIMMLLAK